MPSSDWYDELGNDEDYDAWLERQEQEDLASIQRSLNVFKFFFRFEPEIVLPAAPPENEEEEWNGLHLTAKVWYELEEEV